MFSISWIQNGKVFQSNTPDKATAYQVFHNMRCRLGMCVRLWHTKVKGKPELIL